MTHTISPSDRYFVCPVRTGWAIVDRFYPDDVAPSYPTFELAVLRAQSMNEKQRRAA